MIITGLRRFHQLVGTSLTMTPALPLWWCHHRHAAEVEYRIFLVCVSTLGRKYCMPVGIQRLAVYGTSSGFYSVAGRATVPKQKIQTGIASKETRLAFSLLVNFKMMYGSLQIQRLKVIIYLFYGSI